MLRLLSAFLIIIGTLSYPAVFAGTDIKVMNYSNKIVVINSSNGLLGGTTTLNTLEISKALPMSPEGTVILFGGNIITITDSHVACRTGGPFKIPYGWYLNLSVNNHFIGHICAEKDSDITAHTRLMLGTTSAPSQQFVKFWSIGNYESTHNITPDLSDTGLSYYW